MSPRKLLIAEKRREHSDFKHNTQRLNLFLNKRELTFFELCCFSLCLSSISLSAFNLSSLRAF